MNKAQKLVLVLLLPAALLGAAVAVKEFAPPRTAVVDMAKVFDNYVKKQRHDALLKDESAKAEQAFKLKEDELKAKEDELKPVKEGTDEFKRLYLERSQIQLDLASLKNKLQQEFQEKYRRVATELRDEVIAEIQRYAKAHELDLVLEKHLPAESSKGTSSPRWPIVHYVKPELEITDEIVKILNSRP